MYLINNLYFSNNEDFSKFYYKINDQFYDAEIIQPVPEPDDLEEYPSFSIDLNGSQLLVIQGSMEDAIYQQSSNGNFDKITPSSYRDNHNFLNVVVLNIAIERNGRVEKLPLRPIDPIIVRRIIDTYTGTVLNDDSSDEILRLLNQPVVVENNLIKESYETLLKQIYGLPTVLPEFLVINGLNIPFISFPEVSKIQIERYTIDPLLQPWAGYPTGLPNKNLTNKIITIFGRNGMTYLVKAKYDQSTNQIFPPS